MKIWKRNAIVATVLVLLCAGVYINWTQNQTEKVDLMQTLDSEQVMSSIDPIEEEADAQTVGGQIVTSADQFAQIRLSRQENRDSAVELLQETIAYEEGSTGSETAALTLDRIVSSALAESQIESLVVAKGFTDCVAYMTDDKISIAVSSPEEGLTEAEVALISDIVTSQTEYTLDSIRIIEVK